MRGLCVESLRPWNAKVWKTPLIAVGVFVVAAVVAAWITTDVSRVDLTNIPDVDCSSPNANSEPCDQSQEFAGFGIAGWHAVGPHNPLFIQVKATPDTVADAEAALRAEFIRRYGEGGDGGDSTIFIPVKYDYGELWKWSVILNRFATSAANTIGIRTARVGLNLD